MTDPAVHRPEVRGAWQPGGWFHTPGFYYVAVCGCGAHTPFAMTWETALRTANTHARMVRTRQTLIDDEVERFRAQLDAG